MGDMPVLTVEAAQVTTEGSEGKGHAPWLVVEDRFLLDGIHGQGAHQAEIHGVEQAVTVFARPAEAAPTLGDLAPARAEQAPRFLPGKFLLKERLTLEEVMIFFHILIVELRAGESHLAKRKWPWCQYFLLLYYLTPFKRRWMEVGRRWFMPDWIAKR
jgi:hypothetical protein